MQNVGPRSGEGVGRTTVGNIFSSNCFALDVNWKIITIERADLNYAEAEKVLTHMAIMM